MKVIVGGFSLQPEQSRMVAKLSFYQDANPPHDGGTVEVFLPLQGTIEENTAAALVKARAVLAEAVAKIDEMNGGQ